MIEGGVSGGFQCASSGVYSSCVGLLVGITTRQHCCKAQFRQLQFNLTLDRPQSNYETRWHQLWAVFVGGPVIVLSLHGR